MYLTQALHRAVQQHPDRTAVRFGNRNWTFRECADRVARLAGALQALGMRTGDRIAMLSLNSDRYLEYYMAVPWGGGVLNPCNIRWSASEIVYSLDDSGSSILIVDENFSELAAQFRGRSASLREVIYCGEGEVPAGMLSYEALLADAPAVPDQVRRGEDLAGVFYTGGTTGFPKGVMLSHNNLCISGLALCMDGLTPAEGTYLHAAPMFHLADIGFSTAAWLAGNTHSIVPAFKPESVLDTLERDRVTQTILVPTMVQMLIDHPASKAPRDLSRLKTIFYGASPMSDALLDRAMAAFPHVEFVQGYGMTELSPLATINPAWAHTAEGRALGKHRSAGRAGYCCEVRVVDAEDNEVPRGSVGEIVVRGPNVMQGYWNKPQLTAETVRGGWMHTGDGGYMDQDGFVFIVDRMKDMIITGGENVYSVEVENALQLLPGIQACLVVGAPDSLWGERVHAVIVPCAGMTLDEQAVIAHCRERLAAYKCPRSVEFRESLPMSAAGKWLKYEVRASVRASKEGA
jgi:acyl-CoA synthetase (AMP-forming)/AMP-acid ligase II